jgi:hypothetical protein
VPSCKPSARWVGSGERVPYGAGHTGQPPYSGQAGDPACDPRAITGGAQGSVAGTNGYLEHQSQDTRDGVYAAQSDEGVVVRDRIELSTFRFSGAIDTCLAVAGCRLTGHLAAPIIAGRRPVSLGVCLRWLPVWLPRSGRRRVIRLHICSRVDRVDVEPESPLPPRTTRPSEAPLVPRPDDLFPRPERSPVRHDLDQAVISEAT